VTAELNARPFEASADCIRMFLNDATNVFKLVEITLNRNRNILYIFFFFHASPGILLPDLKEKHRSSIRH
jgi:hypothetical protein